MKKCLFTIFTLAVCFGITSVSYADSRSYVWTYEYMTMPKGAWELEYYFTSSIPKLEKSNVNTLKQQVELEYGITKHWDVAIYPIYKINNKESETESGYDGFKIRTRYRFGEKGKYLIDPLIYLEYIWEKGSKNPNVIEAKIVLAKDIGDLNISYNQIIERNLRSVGKTDIGFSAGVNYRILPVLRLGAEFKGSYNERKTAIGPTVAFSKGKFFVSLGAAWGVNNRTNDLEIRMIAGMLF